VLLEGIWLKVVTLAEAPGNITLENYLGMAMDSIDKSFEEHDWITMIDLFARQVEQTPAAIPLRFNGRCMTYSELHNSTSALVSQIIAQGVRLEDRVAVLARRDLELVVLFLGVPNSGACYIPVDLDTFSRDHTADILARVQPQLVISTSHSGTDCFRRSLLSLKSSLIVYGNQSST